EFRRERSRPLPPEDRRSPTTGRVTIPSADVRLRRARLLLMSALSVLVLLASGGSWAVTGWMSGHLSRFDVVGGLSEQGRPENESGGRPSSSSAPTAGKRPTVRTRATATSVRCRANVPTPSCSCG